MEMRKEGRIGSATSMSFVLLPLLAVLLGACAKKAGRGAMRPRYYPTWRKATDIVLDYPIPGHMGPPPNPAEINTSRLLGHFRSPSKGSSIRALTENLHRVIVKEVYATPKPAPGKGPVQLTIMVKAPKDPRSTGG